FVALISAISLHEFYSLMKTKGAAPLVWLGLLAGLLVNGAFIYERLQVEIYQFFASHGYQLKMFSQLQFLLVVQIVFIILVLIVELFRTKGSALMNVGSTLSGVLVISLCFGLLVGLRELFSYGFPVHKFMASSMFASGAELETVNRWGGFTILAVLASIWMCDTAAYFAGVSFGSHKLFPRVSPGKTWEGAAAGFVAAVATMMVVQYLALGYLTRTDALMLGAIIGVFGQMGDLVESRLKRDAGVKDSSAIIPGHGGVYDRFDSLVFVTPFVYLYVDFVALS
ncbi:MAG: phosphatidate cytidylyltransferase, partial [Ignavibacteriales bacterium]|nr:phosphatidate cytidylyltransferase [Ignavibacteriales bacterium]